MSELPPVLSCARVVVTMIAGCAESSIGVAGAEASSVLRWATERHAIFAERVGRVPVAVVVRLGGVVAGEALPAGESAGALLELIERLARRIGAWSVP